MPDNSKPNFIFIYCDDLGYGDLACYGSELNKTPRLHAMAAEGMRFTDFYVSAPLCSPSRASLMTGCYAQRVGLAVGERFPVLLPGDNIGISPDEVLLPEMLKAQGYATKIIGKWHLGDQPEFLPTRRGFDSFFGLPYSNDMHPDHPFNDWFHFPALPLMRDERIIELDPDQAPITARYTEEAVDFIRQNRERAFFLYLPHMYVHLPLFPPAEFQEQSQNGDYGAEVQCLDWSTGVILDALRDLGIAEKTLVVFTSDNGASLRVGCNAPLRGGKGSTWEGGLREPCLMWWPGTIEAGATCRELATVMDILPTFAGLAGTEVPGDRVIDGRDISGLMYGKEDAQSPHDAFYYYKGHDLEGVRSGSWKYRFVREGREVTKALYDLENDIGETTDVQSEHPDVVARLEALAESARGDLGSGPRKGRRCRPSGYVARPELIPEYMEVSQ